MKLIRNCKHVQIACTLLLECIVFHVCILLYLETPSHSLPSGSPTVLASQLKRRFSHAAVQPKLPQGLY